MSFFRARKSLRDVVVGASLALGIAGGCKDEQPIIQQPVQPIPTETTPEYMPECPLLSAILDAFESGTPLAEQTTLSGGVVLPEGTRVVGMSGYTLHTYAPENTASCLDNHFPQSGRANIAQSIDCSCRPATYSCSLDPEREPVPQWKLLTDESFPELEYCDGIDNNCDAVVDDGFEPDRPIYCPEDPTVITNDDFKPSLCRLGTQYCIDGALTECQDYIGPLESDPCNGSDDDCDRLIDEDDYGQCGYNDLGLCQRGDNFCTEDAEMICLDASWPQEEVCDSTDNDCDGLVDENIPEQLCYTGPDGTLNVGECRAGPEICEDGRLVCYDTLPEEEVCDSLDNDCDGVIDDGLDACASCNPGDLTVCPNPERRDEAGMVLEVYNCGYGTKSCFPDGTWSYCEAPEDLILRDEVEFLLCNNYDDDCDEAVDGTYADDGTFVPLTNSCYSGPMGTAGVGICRAGEQACIAGGIWDPPRCDEVLPEDNDYCGDGLDNNCDGNIDDYERRYGKLDIVLAIDVSGSMNTYINAVTAALRQFLPTISGEDHRFAIYLFGSPTADPNYGDGAAERYLPLSSLDVTVSALERLRDQGGSSEPTADVIYLLTEPSDPIRVRWRSDATPAIILIGDEEPQTNVAPVDGRRPDAPLLPYRDLPEAREACSENIYPCELPGCNSATNTYWVDGDPILAYFYVHPNFKGFWEPLGEVYSLIELVNTRTFSPNMAIAQELLCTEPELEEGE